MKNANENTYTFKAVPSAIDLGRILSEAPPETQILRIRTEKDWGGILAVRAALRAKLQKAGIRVGGCLGDFPDKACVRKDGTLATFEGDVCYPGWEFVCMLPDETIDDEIDTIKRFLAEEAQRIKVTVETLL